MLPCKRVVKGCSFNNNIGQYTHFCAKKVLSVSGYFDIAKSKNNNTSFKLALYFKSKFWLKKMLKL